MMNGKERVLATLRGQETDRLCWSPLIDPYFTSSLPEQGYDELNIPDAARLVGADIIERHCPTIRAVEDAAIMHRVEHKANTELEITETPVGTLTTEKRLSATGHTSFVSKHLIVTLEDLKVYQYVVEHTHYETDFVTFREHAQFISGDGIATSSGPMSPLQEFLQTLCGVVKTIYLLRDYPEETKDCFELMHAQNKAAYRLLGESPTEVIIDYEDTSSTVISPTYYRKYCAPLIDDYAEICHDAGKCFITHMCGKLQAFSDQIQCGQQDGVDSVCPPTTGDTWVYEARTVWGPEKIILGGIEPPALVLMNAQETREYVIRVLDQMPTFRRFILSTGDATSHGTPVENLRAITEVVQSYPWK